MASDRSSSARDRPLWRACSAAESTQPQPADTSHSPALATAAVPSALSAPSAPSAPSATATARRVAEMQVHFEQQLEMVEHRAQMAIATARLDATAEAEKTTERKLQAQSEEFRAEMAELEAQAECALERSATTEHITEKNHELGALCEAQAQTIQRLQAELAELAELRADDRRTHERMLAAKEAEWSDMEHDFIEKTMAVENATRRRTKAEQQLTEAHAELEAMHDSLHKLRADEYDKGLLDDRLRARLQARIEAMGKVHAQLLVDGQLWASAHFSAALADIDSDRGVAANQRACGTQLTKGDTPEVESSSRQERRNGSSAIDSLTQRPDLERELGLERTEVAGQISFLRQQVRYLPSFQ